MPVWKWALLLLISLILSILMYSLTQVVRIIPIHAWLQSLLSIAVSVGMIALYAVFVKVFENHPAGDIPFGKIVPDTLKGLGFGFGYFILLVGLMAAIGVYHVEAFGVDHPSELIAAFFLFLIVGVGEEIVFRGVLFRWIDEKWGFVAALVVSSLFFGFVHIINPGATWWSSLAIAIEAGLLLGAAYKYAGNLWLPIGIHWAWNFTQGNIFGFAVSGGDAGVSLIQSYVTGTDLLTGGEFGAEASLFAPILGLALAVWFIVKSRK